jgi:hypothetical protein
VIDDGPREAGLAVHAAAFLDSLPPQGEPRPGDEAPDRSR